MSCLFFTTFLGKRTFLSSFPEDIIKELRQPHNRCLTSFYPCGTMQNAFEADSEDIRDQVRQLDQAAAWQDCQAAGLFMEYLKN